MKSGLTVTLEACNQRKYLSTWLFLLCLGVWICAGVCPAGASDPVAEVVAVRGEVTAIAKDGASRKLAIKSRIFQEDTITTGANGRMQLMFKDNTVVSLGQNSNISIAQYEYDLATAKGKMSTEVKEGVFRIMGGMITRTSPESFETKTPAGNIGIRGSMYAGTVSNGKLDVVFEGGKGITFTNATGTVEISTPGFGTSVKGFDQQPETPYRFSAAQIETLQKDLAPAPPAGNTGANAPGATRSQPASPATEGAAPGAKTKDAATPGEAVQSGPAATANPEMAAKLTGLAATNPEQAREALREAVATGGLSVDEALSAVLQGLRSPSPESFNNVVNEAVDLGLTLDNAKALVERLKASGGFCK